MNKVYVVGAYGGEYDGKFSYNIMAYLSKDSAELHCKLADEKAKELKKAWHTQDYNYSFEGKSQYDPHLRVFSYDETNYYVEELELGD